ncbi:MAG: hypothetical protein ACO1QR_05985 [Chthoniobacteraceae bacterium]
MKTIALLALAAVALSLGACAKEEPAYTTTTSSTGTTASTGYSK